MFIWNSSIGFLIILAGIIFIIIFIIYTIGNAIYNHRIQNEIENDDIHNRFIDNDSSSFNSISVDAL